MCESYYGIDNAGPAVTNGGVYFTSEHTGWRVFGLDAATGAERFNLTTADTTSATQPAAAGGAVFFAALRGSKVHLVSLDAATGVTRWDVTVPGVKGVAAPPTVAGGSLFIMLDTGLHAFDAATGGVAWAQTNLSSCSNTVPFVDVGAGIVYSTRGRGAHPNQKGGVLALDVKTGTPKWAALPQVDNPWASPVTAGGHVFAGGFEATSGEGGGYYTGVVCECCCCGRPMILAAFERVAINALLLLSVCASASLRADGLDAGSGSLQWQRNLTNLGKTAPSGGGVYADAYAPILSQAFADGHVYVAGAMWNIFALDVATGAVAWRGETGMCGHLWMVPAVVAGVAGGAGMVYAGCDNGELFAFATTTGAQQWKYQGSPGFAARSPVVSDGRVFVGFNGVRGSTSVPDKLVVFAA
eukprot:SAG22_NODE_64_length_23238_cov_83.185566_4_plen_413_part_00